MLSLGDLFFNIDSVQPDAPFITWIKFNPNMEE